MNPLDLQGNTVSRWLRHALCASVLVLLAACGGQTEEEVTPLVPPPDPPASTAEAARFLTQATFGPTSADIQRLMTLGYSAWLDEQFKSPPKRHLDYWNAAHAQLQASSPAQSAQMSQVLESFYQQALTSKDQLRQRVAFALSQIFVVSAADSRLNDNPQSMADYLDTLGRHAFGNYRQLLEAVARHPAMGMYLSHIANQKEDPQTGRVPDENFARELMQLFSIGLHELNTDGSIKRDGLGQPIETYQAHDIAGMAKVFSGWSWAGPDTTKHRFFGWSGYRDAARLYTLMQPYPQFHSTSEKLFLGQQVTAQSSNAGDGHASLKLALDTLAAHPNVGPFIGHQLIQRLVSSNPSPAYIERVAQAFNDNGAGIRGDMQAVIRAILLDPEARDPVIASAPTFGKLREPVLRLTALLRAFGARSDSGHFLIGKTDNPSTQLGQSPLFSPSVFNFYRPGYVPPNTQLSGAGLVAPEMQITHESSVVGYAEYMRAGVQRGFGQNGRDWKAPRPDLQIDYRSELALAHDAEALVDHVWTKLTHRPIDAALKHEMVLAVNSLTIPALKPDSSNASTVEQQKLNRVRTALLLALVAPEFLIQL